MASYMQSNSERYERTEMSSSTSYSRSSKTITSSSSNADLMNDQGFKSIETHDKNNNKKSVFEFEEEEECIERYIEEEQRHSVKTPITVRSLQSPSRQRKMMSSPVKDGFRKVTVSSGSNKIDHFSKTMSSDDEEYDDFEDEEEIVAAESSALQFTQGQPISFKVKVGANEKPSQSPKTPDIRIDEYHTPPTRTKFEAGRQMIEYLSDSDEERYENESNQDSKFRPVRVKVPGESQSRSYGQDHYQQELQQHQKSKFEPIQVNISTSKSQNQQHRDHQYQHNKHHSYERQNHYLSQDESDSEEEYVQKSPREQNYANGSYSILHHQDQEYRNNQRKDIQHYQQKGEKKALHVEVKQDNNMRLSSSRDYADNSIYSKESSWGTPPEKPVQVLVSNKQKMKKFNLKSLPVDITVKREKSGLSEPEQIRVLVSPIPDQQERGFVQVQRRSSDYQVENQRRSNDYQRYQEEKNQQIQNSKSVAEPANVKSKPRRSFHNENVNQYQTDVVDVYKSFQEVNKDLYHRQDEGAVEQIVLPRLKTEAVTVIYKNESEPSITQNTKVMATTSQNQNIEFKEQRRREEGEKLRALQKGEQEVERRRQEVYQRQAKIEQRKQEEFERRKRDEIEEKKRIQELEMKRRMEEEQRKREEYERMKQEEEARKQMEEMKIKRREQEIRKQKEVERRRKEEEQRHMKIMEERRIEEQRVEHEKQQRDEEQRHVALLEQRRLEEQRRLQEEKFHKQVLDAENRRRAEDFQRQQHQMSLQRSHSQKRRSSEHLMQQQQYMEQEHYSRTFPRKLKVRNINENTQIMQSQSANNTPNLSNQRKFDYNQRYSVSASNTPEVRRRLYSDGDGKASSNAIIARTDVGQDTIMASPRMRPKSVDVTKQSKMVSSNIKRSTSQNCVTNQSQQNQYTSSSSTSATTQRRIVKSEDSHSQSSMSKESKVPRKQSSSSLDEARLAHAQQKYREKQILQTSQQLTDKQPFLGSKQQTQFVREEPLQQQYIAQTQQQPTSQSFAPVPKQQFVAGQVPVSQQQFEKGHVVQYSDHSGVRIINGSHVNTTNQSNLRMKSQQQRKEVKRSVQSKAYANISRPPPKESVNFLAVQQKPTPKQKSSKEPYENIRVTAKGGMITLCMEDNERDFNTAETKRLVTGVYGAQNGDNRYQQYAHRYDEQQNRSNEYLQEQQNTQRKNKREINRSAINSLKSENADVITEDVYYTVCTRYFKPEKNDWISNIHRMGKAKVPLDGDHQDKCVFWLQLFDPDKEDITVQKLVPTPHIAEKYRNQSFENRDSFTGQLVGPTLNASSSFDEMDFSYEQEIGDLNDSFEMLQNRSRNNSQSKRKRSDRGSRRNSASSDRSDSSRRRSSKFRLLRKSQENLSVRIEQNSNDYLKYDTLQFQTAY